MVLIAVLSSIPQLRRSTCQGRNTKYYTQVASIKHFIPQMWRITCWKRNTKYHIKYFIPRRGGILGKEETPSVTPNWQVQDNKYQVLHLTMGEEYLPVTKDPLERWEPSPRITFMLTRISLWSSFTFLLSSSKPLSDPKSTTCMWTVEAKPDQGRYSLNWLICGFCLNRKLLYFPLSAD